MRSFKYFDLTNSGYVDKSLFFRAIEKVGVVVDGDKVIQNSFFLNVVKEKDEIFNFYDLDGVKRIFY